MPSNMPEFDLNLEPVDDRDILDREERCQKAIRTLTKAIVMRLFICVLLLWVVFRTELALWTIGLMLFVMAINVAGILPLAAELKKRRQEWKLFLEEEES